MQEARIPYYLALVAVVVFVSTFLAAQPYSVTSPWHSYDKPARSFLRAAVRKDSLALVREPAAPEAAAWALAAAETHPDSFAIWARQAQAWAGNRRGDTTDVFFSTDGYRCNLVLQFTGSGERARIERASSQCLDPR